MAYDAAQAKASRYHPVHNLAPGGVALFVFLGVVHYMGLGLVWMIVRVIRRSLHATAPTAPVPEGETPQGDLGDLGDAGAK